MLPHLPALRVGSHLQTEVGLTLQTIREAVQAGLGGGRQGAQATQGWLPGPPGKGLAGCRGHRGIRESRPMADPAAGAGAAV